MQADDHGGKQSGGGRRRRIGRADDHALRQIVQGNGRGHDQPCKKQLRTGCPALFSAAGCGVSAAFLSVLAGKRICAGGFIQQPVKTIDRNESHYNAPDGEQDPDGCGKIQCIQRLNDHVKADDAEHHAAGKAQQQTDGFGGVFVEQRAHNASKSGTADACQCRHKKDVQKITFHGWPSLPHCLSVTSYAVSGRPQNKNYPWGSKGWGFSLRRPKRHSMASAILPQALPSP